MSAAHRRSALAAWSDQLPASNSKAIDRRAPWSGFYEPDTTVDTRRSDRRSGHEMALSRRRGRHGHARSKTRSANAGGEAAGSLHGFCGAAWPWRPRILDPRWP